MIPEKMLEFLMLAGIGQAIDENGELYIGDKKYDVEKMNERFIKIAEEFLEPYAINSDSKE